MSPDRQVKGQQQTQVSVEPALQLRRQRPPCVQPRFFRRNAPGQMAIQ
jgi:hypothetical protein